MASPHLPGPDEHHLAAPHLPAAPVIAQTHSHSANAYGEDEGTAIDDVDDDYGGGISLVPHFQELVDTTESVMAQSPSWPHPAPSTLDIFDAPPYYMSTPHLPIPSTAWSHTSSYEHSLEPPPLLQEAQLSIQDQASFDPFTSFFHYITPEKPTVPGLDLVHIPDSITRNDLEGDKYDCQGIDWTVRNTTRATVRKKRADYEEMKLPLALRESRKRISSTPATDNLFQFRRHNTAHRAFFPHFQLRNVLAATSRSDIFYAAGQKVFRTDAGGTSADAIIDLTKPLAPDGSITTIATRDNILIAGAFDGEYAITNLSSTYGTPCTFGRTTDFAEGTKSKIVNHAHLCESRVSYSPQAILCSNDYRLRILDCAINRFNHTFQYPAAVNCSATSPDGRMRVVVGDFQETLITNAETGQPFETLLSHTDDAFACAWADDGIHVATAAQDSTIVIWDARNWGRQLKVLDDKLIHDDSRRTEGQPFRVKSELSIPRSLHFSPVGSGPRILVAAEADDYINVINAQTFESKQVFDFFGPIAGAAFTPDGQSLFIANGERRFGGITELERLGWAERSGLTQPLGHVQWDDYISDWAHDDELDYEERAICGNMERERRHLDLRQLIV